MKGTGKKAEAITKPFDLEESVAEAIKEIVKEKEDNPEFFSYSFIELHDQPHMSHLIKAVHEYTQQLVTIEKKVQELRSEGKLQEADAIVSLESEKVKRLAQQLAQKYSQLLINLRKYGVRDGDQTFFETLIYFILKVLKPAYEKPELTLVEEELGRLFRSTAFNKSRRRNQDIEMIKKFPQLKNYSKKDPDAVINAIIQRNNIPKHLLRGQSRNQAIRVGYVRLSPYKAMTTRSPLLSTILPSPHDQIRNFEEARKQRLRRVTKALPPITDVKYAPAINII